MPGVKSRSVVVIALVLGMFLFAWPAIVNGGPFFHPDTTSYIRGADGGLAAITGHKSEWSGHLQMSAPNDPVAAATEEGWSDLEPTRPVLTGRSVYYGAFLFVLLELFGRWGVVAAQAAIALTTVVVLLRVSLRAQPDRAIPLTPILVVLLGCATSLPFYVSMMMPDLFTGLLIATLASLLVFWDRMTRLEIGFLVAIAAAAVTFHTTHMMLTAFMIAVSIVLVLLRVPISRKALLVAPAILVVGLASQFVYTTAVKAALNSTPIGPPFLSARITDSGPGVRYLREHCTDGDWALCKYTAILPVDSDTFLWSMNPKEGVFSPATLDEKRRLGREDFRFFRAVAMAYPVDVAMVSLHTIGRQASLFGYPNFNYSDNNRKSLRDGLPASELGWVERSRAMLGTMPTTVPRALMIASSLLAVLTILGLALSGQSRASRPVVGFAILLLLGVMVNTMICGALSKPHQRYQMRVVWLLPFGALLALGTLRARSQRKTFPAVSQ